MLRLLLALAWTVTGMAAIPAQSQPPALVGAQFDVVSIKRNTSGEGGGFQFLPDGSFRSTNTAVSVMVRGAAPLDVFEVVGLPDWAKGDGYDIIAKTPSGANPSRDQRAEMFRNLLGERMKFAAHVEEQERNGFALVVARRGRLGPQLRTSMLECVDVSAKCGVNGLRFLRAGGLDAPAIRMNEFAGALRVTVGGPVTDRTGLDGRYEIALRYAPPRLDPAAPQDDAPDIFTAFQEQLGLKLVPEKTKVRIFVVDHIERPTPD